MTKTWKIKKHQPVLQSDLSEALNIPPIVAQLLINRNITDIKEAAYFLSADLSDLHDPFLLKNMDVAIKRIKQAQEKKEKVLVFGDYDVDGVTSSTLLTLALKKSGLEVVNYIPHRMKDGYGLNKNVAQFAKENNVNLFITVDCGITAIEEVATINAVGIEVIILDHHLPSEKGVPDAFAIINPKQEDCPYPFKYLAAVGLVVKFIHALEGEVRQELLDFAAIGTVADMVPLHGENRILVKAGLPSINTTSNKGLSALLNVSKINGKTIKPYHIGFVIGPRINAAGRMDSAHASLDLFLSEDLTEAEGLAAVLENYNSERQKMQRNVVEEALDLIENDENIKNQKIIVIGKEGWHKGVVGIVASRVKDKYSRPAIVIAIKDGVGTASARSIDGFHLHEALSQCSEHLEEFGGHAGAAGLTIKEENIPLLVKSINTFALTALKPKALNPVLHIDAEINLADINLSLIQKVNAMEPFGEGNPEPLFCSYQVRVNSLPQTLGRNTLKFWIAQNGTTISAVGFGMGELKNKIKKGQTVDISYQLGIDDWNKAPTPQLMLKDIKL
ncbi:Single-stranded-DNA-specific exonuclease RecJ [hydrothermal vent metagenome]|uniref:Single-stranded-DNA-specific exonuclease RecJ n=1 Tax=hydrothermal vent metagenome TaxID=652676 RepID=A0A3B1DMS1_9ZZZZ